MPRWLVWSAGIAALIAFERAEAAPDGDPVRLLYGAPAECPGAAAFLEQVRSRTRRARDPLPGEVPRTFQVSIELRGPTYVGTLSIQEPSGAEAERRLAAKACPDVVEALALVVALAIDPRAATTTSRVEPPGGQPPKVASPPPAPPEAPPAPPPGRPGVSAEAGVHTGAANGLCPGTQLEVGVTAGFLSTSRRPLAPAIWLDWLHFPRTLHVRTGGNVAFQSELLGVDVCPLASGVSAHTELRGCARLELGRINATGEQTLNPRTIRTTWLAPGLRVRAGVSPFHPLWLAATGALVVPAARDRFLIGGEVLHEQPIAALRVDFTLTVRPW